MEENGGMLLKTLVEEIGLQIVHKSTDYETKMITNSVINRPGLQLAGFYDYFPPKNIQIIGKIENAYLMQFSAEERLQKFDRLFSTGIPALLIAHDTEILPECIKATEIHDITILKSQKETSELIVSMISRLKDELAPSITRHGVFVEIYGEGILIVGDSGIGKSEAAIELIKRGHRLIADDAVVIKRVDSKTLMGSAPELIRNYIELRGIGVVDVRRIFGLSSVKWTEKIDLIVQLETWKPGTEYDRIGNEYHYMDILDVKVPHITIPIQPGRNLAVILEVAAMNNRQKRQGYDSAKEFAERIDHYFDTLQG
ncbi:MAG: HPr(Ser) kinase/phosphatase [Oscillospiraceae bacterium]|nr:HPr(Ser) kinase/phosphatase [Oscillospiraceae bacterium]